MKKCPCNSQLDFDKCCQPYLTGRENAPTAEKTMRARYSAFVTGNIDYIENTYHPEERKSFNRQEIEDWSLNSKWLGFEIIRVENGTNRDKVGTVEFKAVYEAKGVKQEHHEISYFKKEKDFWYFTDGKIVRETIRRETPKIGRNDPCPCGSQKKYKKCCAK